MLWKRGARIDEWATSVHSGCRRFRIDRVKYGGTIFFRPMQRVAGVFRVFRHRDGRVVTCRTRKRAAMVCELAAKSRAQLELFA